MNAELFDLYEAARSRGDNRLSTKALKEFIDSFCSNEEREDWTRWYLTNRSVSQRMRHEIFEGVVFPVLLTGYKLGDPWCIGWLEACMQNLYSAKHLWAQIGYKSALELAEELVAASPCDADAKQRVLSHLIAWFHHCEHEWPAGILYGMNGATPEQCKEIGVCVVRAKALDEQHEHADFLASFETKVDSYLQRLTLSAGTN
ncbi:MAG: hypothetical protein KA260_04235 [Burkholderiales bacterium]|nr:hypothetical protein [Burkholderiales bacterium]